MASLGAKSDQNGGSLNVLPSSYLCSASQRRPSRWLNAVIKIKSGRKLEKIRKKCTYKCKYKSTDPQQVLYVPVLCCYSGILKFPRFLLLISFFRQVYKEDLDLKNHLVGLKQLYLKLEFLTVPDMTRVSGPGNEKWINKAKLLQIRKQVPNKYFGQREPDNFLGGILFNFS